MAAKNNKMKKRAFLEKYENTLGNVAKSCKAAQVSRRTYYDWMERDAEFAEKVEEVAESSLDFAESKLKQLINEGNPTATIFYLKTKGKKRGYVEQTDVNVSGSVNLRPLTDEEIEELRALNGR